MWKHGQSFNPFRVAAKRDGHRRSPISISRWPCLEPPCAGTRRVVQPGPSRACETILISAQRALVASKRPKGPLGEARCAHEVFFVAAHPPVTRPFPSIVIFYRLAAADIPASLPTTPAPVLQMEHRLRLGWKPRKFL